MSLTASSSRHERCHDVAERAEFSVVSVEGARRVTARSRTPVWSTDDGEAGQQRARTRRARSPRATPAVRGGTGRALLWRMLREAFFGCSLVAACWTAVGCTPATPYRYSGMVPAARPIPFDGRTAEEGTARLEGSITRSNVHENLTPQLHDTALWVPHTTIDASGAIAIAKGVELGGRFTYSSYDWSRPSALGTMPLHRHPTGIGFGPELRATIPVQGAFAIGLAGNVLQHRMPTAEYTRTTTPCATGEVCFTDPSTTELGGTTYRLTKEGLEWHWSYGVYAYPSYAFGDGRYGHLFGMLGLQRVFQNDGFTDKTAKGDAIQGAGALTIVGIGYGISLTPVRVSASAYKPLTESDSPIRYGWGGILSLGFDLELWEGRKPTAYAPTP